MDTPASSLRIAVLGVGKIGSTFAFQLARTGGYDVTVIARPGSAGLQQLQRDNGIVDVHGERAGVKVDDRLDEATAYDLLIVTLLDHQTAAFLPNLRRCSAKCIQFMCNTFNPEHLQDGVGAERCAFGMAFVQATLDGEGRLKSTIGAGGQKTIMNQQRWVDVFNAAAVPATLEPDMPLWLRCHVPMCIAFESIAVAAQRRGGGATWQEAMVLARGVHASFDLIRKLGYQIYPRAKKLIEGSPVPILAATLWSMSRIAAFREVLATGQVECQSLVDVVVAAAPAGYSSVNIQRIQAMKPAQDQISQSRV